MPVRKNSEGCSHLRGMLFTFIVTMLIFFILFKVEGVRDPRSLLGDAWSTIYPMAKGLFSRAGEKGEDILKRSIRRVADKSEMSDESRPQGRSLSPETQKVVREYLLSPEASELINRPPTVYGGTWYFLEPKFLADGLIKVDYEDGHAHGTMILKVDVTDKEEPRLKVIWDSLNP